MIGAFGSDISGRHYDFCVVGAGPSGIALAIELAHLGRTVLLLESGQDTPDRSAQALADAEIITPAWHVSMGLGVQRRLGGAGNLWGGRCVPLDPCDFENDRPQVPYGGWPIGTEDLAPFMARGCELADIGSPEFVWPIPGLSITDPDFTADHLERWCREPRPQVCHAKTLAESLAIDVRLGATLAAVHFEADRTVGAITVQAADGTRVRVQAPCFVLACGGVENARILLNAQADPEQGDPTRFGGEQGPLGRYYMGHLYGSISEIQLANDVLDAALDYLASDQGVYVRRRFNASAELQAREQLLNLALWPEFPAIYQAEHRNGVLSTAYLALRIGPVGRLVVVEPIRQHYIGSGPLNLWPHLRNVLLDLPNTISFIPRFLWRRKVARPRQPGFFQRNAARRYALRYHGESRPNPDSRVTLGEARDAVGLRRAVLDLRFTDADAQDLVRSHALFAAWLERTGLGRLEWSAPVEELTASVLAQSYDGHHQMGTTRMSDSPTGGVVDRDCRVFGAGNLYIAGTSVMPTSSQANPTLTAIVLAVRLAAHLAKTASR
jgi:choline dehydrogenase-like flavoprotein